MSQYIAHILNINADSINVYEQTNSKSSMFNISSLDELNILNDSDSLLVLIPSSTVTSYEFEENKSLSKQINIANFISEVDSSFADPVSNNDYFLHNNAAYVVDKLFLKNLNTSLSELNTKIYVLPEYLINVVQGNDVITEFEGRFMISYSNKTGFALDHSSLSQYIEIVLNKNPNFNPLMLNPIAYPTPISSPIISCPRKKETSILTNSRIKKSTSSLTESERKLISRSNSSITLRLELRK